MAKPRAAKDNGKQRLNREDAIALQAGREFMTLMRAADVAEEARKAREAAPPKPPYQPTPRDIERVAARLEDFAYLLDSIARLTLTASEQPDDGAAIFTCIREAALTGCIGLEKCIVKLTGRSYLGFVDPLDESPGPDPRCESDEAEERAATAPA